MLIYFLPIFLLPLTIFAPKENRNLIYIIFAILLIVFSGFRNLGIDKDSSTYFYGWFVYIRDFTILGDPLSNSIFFINRFYSAENMRLSLLIFALLGVSIKFYFYMKVSRVIWISLLIYYSYFFFVFEMTQVRAGVALSFSLLSVFFYVQRRYNLFFIFSAIAFLFHTSSLVIFFILLFGVLNWSSLIIFILGIISFFSSLLGLSLLKIAAFIMPSAFAHRLNFYLETTDPTNILNPFTLVYFSICSFMILCIYQSPARFSRIESASIKLNFIAFILLFLFKDSIHLSYRLYDIFLIFLPITISIFVSIFKQKVVFCFLVFSLSIISVYNQIYRLEAFKEYEMGLYADQVSGFDNYNQL